MDNKIKLELIGITYNQIESGVYALILQQEGTSRRIPIIIGSPEAQAIECKLQNVRTPRPLTHDMMASALGAFGITVSEVVIRKLPNGVFAADIRLSDSAGNSRTVDSRASDAIALAIRVGAEIYTTSDVLDEAGFDAERPFDRKPTGRGNSSSSVAQLAKEMQKAVEREDYEEAARIKRKIDSLSSQSDGSTKEDGD